MLSLLIVPAEYAAAVRGSITSCLENIVPSLFLFMVATQICMEYGILSRLLRPFSGVMRLLRLPPAAFEALVIGNVAGFPMGARVACRLYTDGRLERGQAERLLAFCNNCGPAFLIGAVGAAIWGDAGLGVALWGVQLAASLVVGLLFRGRRETYDAAPGTQRDAPRLRRSFSAAFVAAVKNSAVSVLYVCAFIVFMSCASVILRFGGFSTRLGAFEGLLLGVFEITMGIGALPGRSALAFAMALRNRRIRRAFRTLPDPAVYRGSGAARTKIFSRQNAAGRHFLPARLRHIPASLRRRDRLCRSGRKDYARARYTHSHHRCDCLYWNCFSASHSFS